MHDRNRRSVARRLLERLLAAAGAVGGTFVLFLVLPLMQAIAKGLEPDVVVRSIDTGYVPPPPPVDEEPPEPEDEPEPEEPPPELEEEIAPIDLADLEAALGLSGGDGWGASGDFSVGLDLFGSAANAGDEIFGLDDLDQEPRLIYSVDPTMTAKLRKRAPATVRVAIEVDLRGRVLDPRVLSSTDSAFESATLEAVKKWKFEPGKKNGEPVRFRMKIPITFPAG